VQYEYQHKVSNQSPTKTVKNLANCVKLKITTCLFVYILLLLVDMPTRQVIG